MTATREEWALAALAMAAGGTLDHFKMQKVLFLLSKRIRERLPADFYSFRAHKYGPVSPAVYDDFTRLEVASKVMHDSEGKVYVLTAHGRRDAEDAPITADEREYLRGLVESIQHLPFKTLAKRIYAEFPEMATNTALPHLVAKQGTPYLVEDWDGDDEVLKDSRALDAQFGEDWAAEAAALRAAGKR